MASQSMADYLRTAGSIVMIGWLLSPVFSLLVNKLFAFLFSDVSRKFRNLETIIVPDLEQTLKNVHEQRMQRSFEDDKESPSVVNTLVKLEEDLKSAFYEAQDTMDVVDYHRAEEEAVGHASSWVQQRLAAAGACIALCCFRRSWVWLGPWIDVTRARAAALQPCALKLYQLGRSIIHGLLSKMHAAIHIARTLLLHWTDSLFRQHLGKFRGATPRTSGALLPVSVVETSVSGSGGSMVGPGILSSTSPTALEATTMDAVGELGYPKPPLQRSADMVVEEEHEKVEEIEEEKVLEEKVKNDEEQENVEEEEKVKEEEQQEEQIEEKVDEEKVKEEEKTEENRALYRCVQQYFEAMLIYLTKAIAFARSYRDWSYEVVGIESNQVPFDPLADSTSLTFLLCFVLQDKPIYFD